VFEEGTTGYLLLKALRKHIEVDVYASFEVHTERTIASGRERLTKFYELMGVSLPFVHLSNNISSTLVNIGIHHRHKR
jgi:hypothetical protein